MSLKYEPASEPLHIYVNPNPNAGITNVDHDAYEVEKMVGILDPKP